MSKKFFIKNKNIMESPYIIAEIGINHEGNIETAKKLIKHAKKAGANAVKFQVFRPEVLATPKSKKTNLQKKSMSKETISEMWKRVCLNESQIIKLKKLSNKLDIDFICSFFDKSSLDIVNRIGVDAFKVASSDINDEYLLYNLKKVKKPIILSTGMASLKEIKRALSILKGKKVCILHCISMYPCPNIYANLSRINSLKKKFNLPVGYSDHCKDTQASIQAIAYGSNIIEKHFTLNKKIKGADHSLSADFKDLKKIVEFGKEYKLFNGNGDIEPSKKEKKYRKFFRKSIYFDKDLKINSKLNFNNLIIKRPESFYKPKDFMKLIGKKTKKIVKKYQSVSPKVIK